MAVGDLLTGPGQVEIGESFLIGADASRILGQVSGLGLPTVQTDDLESPTADGAVGGRDRYAPRQVVISTRLNAASRADLSAEVDLLAAAMNRLTTGTTTLAFRLGSTGKRFLRVRPRGLDVPWGDTWEPHGLARDVVLTAVALDPYAYSTVEDSTDVVIASSGTSNSGSVANDGNAPSAPTVTIVGPCTNPRVAFDLDGTELRLSGSFTALETIVVDLRTREVTLDGVTDYTILAADTEWPVLLPGSNSITYTRDDSPASTSTATIDSRDAYLSGV